MAFVLGLKEELKSLCRRMMEENNIEITSLSILWTSVINPILVNVSTMPGEAAF